jgi:hypothetical protein
VLYRLWHAFDPFFPEREIFHQRLSFRASVLLFVVFAAIFSLFGTLIPGDGYFGYDWFHFFGIGQIPPYYPPWTLYIVRYLTYPFLIGITLAAISVATFQRSIHPVSAVAAFLSFPVLWTIFLGQIDGLSTFGLLGMPWLVPLVLMKPQIAIFGLGAKRSYLLAFFIFLILSILILGNWPGTMFSTDSFKPDSRDLPNISLGLWGIPLFLLTIWFSRGDMDMLMVCGAFVTPYIIFYNLLPLTPAVSRLKPGAAIIALILSFLTLSANWLGPNGWWLGWAFAPWIWINLAAKHYPNFVVSRLLNKVFG